MTKNTIWLIIGAVIVYFGFFHKGQARVEPEDETNLPD